MVKKSTDSWRNIKPTNPSDPVRHNVSSIHRIGDWYILGASVRGKRHAHAGEWREDSYAVTEAGQWTIVSVADGAGSAPLSRVGSRIAVRRMNNTLKRGLFKLDAKNNVEPFDEQSFINDVSNCLKEAFFKVMHAIEKECAKRECPKSHLATTLLSVLYTHRKGIDWFFWFNVGDCVFTVFPDSEKCEVLCDEDHGSSAGETRFITTSGIIESLSSRVRYKAYPKHVYSFALMTDGVADDLYPLGDRLKDLIDGNVVGKGYMYDNKGKPLTGIIHFAKNDNMDAKRLTEWLKYDKTGSVYDDRTLIVIIKSN